MMNQKKSKIKSYQTIAEIEIANLDGIKLKSFISNLQKLEEKAKREYTNLHLAISHSDYEGYFTLEVMGSPKKTQKPVTKRKLNNQWLEVNI